MARVYTDIENYVPSPGNVMDPEDNVERDGYRTLEEMINEAQEAGLQLEEFRKIKYPYERDHDDISTELGALSVQGMDAVDVRKLYEQKREEALNARRKKQEEEQKKADDMKKQIEENARLAELYRAEKNIGQEKPLEVEA